MTKKSLRYKIFKVLILLCFVIIACSLTAAYFFMKSVIDNLPDVHTLQNVQYQIPLKVYSHDNLLIARFGEKKRTPIKIEAVPPLLINAFLAAEDDRFYRHPGVDYQGLLRAGIHLLLTGKKTQGGSTITMQVTRNFLLTSERTYIRKLKEIILALKIEATFSKQQILELYLNKIYLGQRSYGVIAAAETYFGKPLNELNLAEFALIAGLPKGPSLYNPITDSERAKQRRDYVLHRMHELGYINAEQLDSALAQLITTRTTIAPEQRIELDAPYIAEMARQYVVEHYGEEAAYSDGLAVYTTITRPLQNSATQALQDALHQYDQRHGYRKPSKQPNYSRSLADYSNTGDTLPAQVVAYDDSELTAKLADNRLIVIAWKNLKWAIRTNTASAAAINNILNINDVIRVRQLSNGEWALCQIPKVEGAFVALNPQTGAILALQGGFDFFNNKYNRVTQSQRQPGSGFKPIIYTTALENGFTPATMVNDAPIVIDDPTLKNGWRPENFGGEFYGPTSVRNGLKKSRNIVAIKLLMAVGIDKAVETAVRFGFKPEEVPHSYSMALGSGEAAPLQMARMYSVFANGGSLVTPYFVERIEANDGKILFQAQPETPKRIISPAVNFLMNSMLRDVVEHGTATRAKSLGRNDLAGKTGTTNDQKDAWFNGFTQTIAATAWVGFDNPAPLGSQETGGEAALPMWMSFMRQALKDQPQYPLEQPEGIVKGYINPYSGQQLPIGSSGGVWEYFDSSITPRASEVMPRKPKSVTAAEQKQQLRQNIESLF